MLKYISLIIIIVSIAGCATPPIAMNYAPSSLLKTNGNLNITKFTYKPFLDKKVEENEIKTTTIGYFKIESSIAEFVSNATKLEFKFMGTELSSNSTNTLKGEILDFLFDDLGFSVDTTLVINYVLSTNDRICFQKEIKTKKTAAKFVNPTGLVSEVIKNNIETLAQEPIFSKCLAK